MAPTVGCKGTPEERFWGKIRKTRGCWIWIGSTNPNGYGQLRVTKRKLVLAHRFSYELHKGRIPKRRFVLHKCDNPPCVKPTHLKLGNNSDNMKDASRKGRLTGVRGFCNPQRTETEVRKIRRLYKEGVSLSEIARKLKASLTGVFFIAHRRTWRWVK